MEYKPKEFINKTNKTITLYLTNMFDEKINENGNILENVKEINRLIKNNAYVHDISYFGFNCNEIMNHLKDILKKIKNSKKGQCISKPDGVYTYIYDKPLRFEEIKILKIERFLTEKSKYWVFEFYKIESVINEINSLFKELKEKQLNKENIVHILERIIELMSKKIIQAAKAESREREEWYKQNNIQGYFEEKLEIINKMIAANKK